MAFSMYQYSGSNPTLIAAARPINATPISKTAIGQRNDLPSSKLFLKNNKPD